MKKKIVIFVFMLFLGINSCLAKLTFKSEVTGGGSYGSNACGNSSSCARMLIYRGLKITIVDENYTLDAKYAPLYIWDVPNKIQTVDGKNYYDYENSPDEGYALEVSRKEGTYNNRTTTTDPNNSFYDSYSCTKFIYTKPEQLSINFGARQISSKDYWRSIIFEKEKKGNLTINNVYDSKKIEELAKNGGTIIKILSSYFSLCNEDSCDALKNKKMKIEIANVYLIKKGTVCYYFPGTPSDLYYYSKYSENNFDVLKPWIYEYSDTWNVIANRLLNPVKDSSVLDKYSNNRAGAINDYYTTGNLSSTGLGVGYIEIKNYITQGKLKIIKVNGNDNNKIGGAEFAIYKDTCTGSPIKKYTTADNGEITIGNLESGTYCIKETQAPYGYKMGNSEKIVNITAGETNSVEFKNFKYPVLKIYKYKAGTKKALSGAEFTVYEGNCENKGARIGRDSTNEDGFLQFMLNKRGAYCVEETQAPNNYINSNSSKNVYLKFGDDITLEFENELDCKGEFEEAKVNGEVSMQDRIKIFWGKYSIDGKGRRYNQLLNLTNKDATSACQYKKPTYTPQITCFNFKYPSNSEFNANNLSNYNEQFFSNGYINFCLTTTNIYTEKKLPSDKIKVKAGMIVFDDKLQLKVVKTCYKYQYDNAYSASNSGFNYTLNDVWINKYRTSFTENIINNVRINKLITDYEYINEDKINYLKDIPNGSKSIPTNDKDTNLKTSEVDGKITYEYTYKYEYTPISLLYGSGKNIASKGKYSNNFNVPGIISTFSESGSQIIKFGVKYKDYTDNKDIYINTEDDDANCKYTVDQAIITGSNLLNLQFEQVNLKNPFIEKNNNPITDNVTIRKVGSNWRSIDINSFDLNGDGVRNEIDEAIKKYAIDVIKNYEASENGDNYLVKYVMNGRPNSYSKDKPKYVITLTPSDIKAIRNYNDSNDYQDYEKVYCTDSNNVLCSTDFIDNLKTTDPKVCVGDTCEKLSSGINFKREVTGGSDVKDASYIKFSLSNSDYGKIEGDMNIVVKKGDKIEFPELNIKEGYGLLGWITKNENNRFNYNNYIDISNVTATLGTQEYMAVLAKEHKIYRETDGNNSYVCTVLSRKSMQESGCPRLADPSNASGFEGWKYNNRVIDNYYTRKFITDNDDFIITFTPSYTQIKIYESIEVVMNNTKIRYSKRGVDIVSKIDKIIGTYSMNGKIFSEPINKNQCEYDGDVHSTRLGKNAFRARCKRIYSKYIDYEIVKIPLDYIETNKNALGAGIFTIYTNSNYENEISEAYIKDSENNTHKFERTHLGLRIDLKEFVPGKYPVGDYWFDLVFKGKNEDLITCKFKVTKTKLGLIPKRDVIICPEYQ